MRRAHLLVCRAGASTLAELAAVGRAAILVPYPFAANNHQEFNARFLAAAGAGEIILNKDFTGEAFAGKINQFLTAPEHLANMEAASRQLAKPEAAKRDCGGVFGVDENVGHRRSLGSGNFLCIANLSPPSPQPPPIKGGGV